MKSGLGWVLRSTASCVALAACYRYCLRERCLTWGAVGDEAGRRMPGDDLLDNAGIVTTRAVTVHTPPSAIWPWLVQMGPGRGGAYTYDWIENLLGLDMHSARTILPEFQHLAVGDAIPMGKGPRLRVARIEPERFLVLESEDGQWVWAFGLYACAEGTRLVSRNRIATPAAMPVRLFYTFVMEPGSLVMERKMLLGIRQRAERHACLAVDAAPAAEPESTPPAPTDNRESP